MIKSKAVLILHGWPQPIENNNKYCKYFENKGYKVIAPKLFDDNFDFSIKGIEKYLNSQIKDFELDVIVGISMGTLLVPYIAVNYPKAKLVFIAGGSSLKSKSAIFNILFSLMGHKFSITIFNLIRKIPTNFLIFLYKLVNPFKKGSGNFSDYLSDTILNCNYIKSISGKRQYEIVNLLSKIDNTNILKGLNNSTIIFSGSEDVLMPSGKPNTLKSLIKNSILIENDRSHFEVFTDENFTDLDKFLN